MYLSSNGAACSCLYGVKNAVPCSHSWLVATKLGLEMEQVMHHSLTWNGWHRHYHDARGREIEMKIPTQEDLDRFKHLIDPNLQKPFTVKRPRGRPKRKARFPCVLEQIATGARKNMRKDTCRACWQKGHKKGSKKCQFYVPLEL